MNTAERRQDLGRGAEKLPLSEKSLNAAPSLADRLRLYSLIEHRIFPKTGAHFGSDARYFAGVAATSPPGFAK
jgi:hypothetical protein